MLKKVKYPRRYFSVLDFELIWVRWLIRKTDRFDEVDGVTGDEDDDESMATVQWDATTKTMVNDVDGQRSQCWLWQQRNTMVTDEIGQRSIDGDSATMVMTRRWRRHDGRQSWRWWQQRDWWRRWWQWWQHKDDEKEGKGATGIEVDNDADGVRGDEDDDDGDGGTGDVSTAQRATTTTTMATAWRNVTTMMMTTDIDGRQSRWWDDDGWRSWWLLW